METADVTLLDSNLEKLEYSISMGRKVIRKIKENVIFSLAVKFVVLGFALAGKTHLWAAIASDVGAMILVTMNSMMLLPRRQKSSDVDALKSDVEQGTRVRSGVARDLKQERSSLSTVDADKCAAQRGCCSKESSCKASNKPKKANNDCCSDGSGGLNKAQTVKSKCCSSGQCDQKKVQVGSNDCGSSKSCDDRDKTMAGKNCCSEGKDKSQPAEADCFSKQTRTAKRDCCSSRKCSNGEEIEAVKPDCRSGGDSERASNAACCSNESGDENEIRNIKANCCSDGSCEENIKALAPMVDCCSSGSCTKNGGRKQGEG